MFKMSSRNWFLRFRSELPTQKVRLDRKCLAPSIVVSLTNQSQRLFYLNPAPDYTSSVNSHGGAPLLRCRLEEWQLRRHYHASLHHATLERCYHASSPPLQAQLSLDYSKLGYYMPGSPNEEVRSKIKAMAAKKVAPAEKTPSVAQSQPASRAEANSSVAKLERARMETAREFVNLNPGAHRDDALDEPIKVVCPKPNLESPYLNTSEDCEDESPSLRNHYKKVLQQPDRHMGVFFHRPRQKSFTYKPHMKPRKLAQYFMVNQNQSFCLYAPVSATVSFRGLHSDETSTPLCNGNNYAYFKSTDNTKRVDTVTMEIVKMEKPGRKTERLADINSELWRVLGEALSQSKENHQNTDNEQVHQMNVLKSKQLKVIALPPKKSAVDLLVTARSELNPPASDKGRSKPKELEKSEGDHDSRVIQVHPNKSQNKEVNNPGPQCVVGSSDGKHCYNVLYSPKTMSQVGSPGQSKTLTLDKVDSKRMSSNMKSCPVHDFSETFTDLTDYDDGSEAQDTSFPVTASTEDLAPVAVAMPKQEDSREMDIKLAARKQHNQRVVEVFEDFNNIHTY